MTFVSEDPRWESLEIVRELGAGATSVVYEARLEDGATVVLKLGRDASAAPILAHELRALVRGASARGVRPRAIGWWERGALLTARRFGSNGALPGLLMTGGRRPLVAERDASTIADAARVVMDVAGHLAELHAGGIAHGDVKLENVVMDDAGQASLIDLGLSAEVDDRAVRGGTPRYLLLGDADLSDARARDLAALGLLAAELAEPSLRTSDLLGRAARKAVLPPPFADVCAALLVPNPEARPRAAWVRDRLGSSTRPGRAEEAALLTARNAYVALRPEALATRSRPARGTASLLAEACPFGRQLAAIHGGSPQESGLPPRETKRLETWLVRVAGAGALHWPLFRLAAEGEDRIERALLALQQVPSHAWTIKAFEEALAGSTAARSPRGEPDDLGSLPEPDRLVAVALALTRTPPSEGAIAFVEERGDTPLSLVAAAAQALRRRGDTGRALALSARLSPTADPTWLGAAAEIHRRAGDAARARALAERALEIDPGRAEVADACLARLALDRGDPEAAIARLQARSTPLALEGRALALAHLGRFDEAISTLDSAQALPKDEEQRARLEGARGYVLAPHDPEAAYRAYGAAVAHAVAASALLEEATYLTGVGATGVDVGYLSEAAAASERAAAAWDFLGMGPRAARATLNAAAAYATAGRSLEPVDLAKRAMELASRAADLRARGFAACVVADASALGGAEGRDHALAAKGLLSDPSDALRAASRALRHGVDLSERSMELDLRALGSEVQSAARMEWIAERLRQASRGSSRSSERLDALVTAAVGLASSPGPIGSKGPLLAAALLAARDLGRGEAALRLASELRACARVLRARVGPALGADVEHLDWMRIAAAERPLGEDSADGDKGHRLEQLVRSLGEDRSLRDLSRTILDALVTWTGVERGLMLLRAPDGALVPRGARNLAQRDLTGPQLDLSMSLAKLALERREPVVAVDAAGELPRIHQSAHALSLRSVLAVPLIARAEVVGVVYLDDRVRRGAFGERELAWVRTVATLAATMVARAMDEARLKRLAARARRGREGSRPSSPIGKRSSRRSPPRSRRASGWGSPPW